MSADPEVERCPHRDVRYFEEEFGAIACMDCARLFGHLVDEVMVPHNPVTVVVPVAEVKRLRALLERIAADLDNELEVGGRIPTMAPDEIRALIPHAVQR